MVIRSTASSSSSLVAPLLVALFGLAAGATSSTLTTVLEGDQFTLWNGTTAVFSDLTANSTAASDNSTSWDLNGGQVQWFAPPQPALLTDLSDTFQALFANTTQFVNLAKISQSGLYIVADTTQAPFVTYFGGTGEEEYTCSPVALSGPVAFSCNFTNTSTTFGPIAIASVDTDGTAGLFSIEATIDLAFSSALVNQISALVAFRLQSLSSLTTTMTDQILSSNQDRRTVGYQVVGGGAFIAILAMVGHIVFAATFFSWVAPIFSGFLSAKTSLRNSTSTDLWIWFVILTILVLCVSLGGGLPGWAFMVILLAAAELAILITYVVVRVRAKNSSDPTSPVPDSIEMTDGSPKDLGEYKSRALWTYYPYEMGYGQSLLLVISAILIVVCIVILIIIAAVWSVSNYYVIDRETYDPVVELQQASVSKSTMTIYTLAGAATVTRMNFFLVIFTSYCGYSYNVTLSDSDKPSALYADYIEYFNIDMNQFEPSDYMDYYSVNNWFIRQLKNGSRPIDSPTNNDIVTSAADARVFVFTDLPDDFKMTVKEENFDIPTLVNNASIAANYQNGSMIIWRLAPQDYHRFHSPISGTVTYVSDVIPGTIFAVNADAVRSDNAVYYNKRQVVVIDTGSVGQITLVIVGATCVGSIVLNLETGDSVQKGEEIGFFQYGGSTVIGLFENGAVTFDDDLLYSSAMSVETFVKMGTKIASKDL